MPRPSPTLLSPRSRAASAAPDPALAELRALSISQLTDLLQRWLAPPRPAREFQLRVQSVQGRTVTLVLSLGTAVLPLPAACRIHQRCTSLQLQHVDAFTGYLLRTGAAVGTLITTGEVTSEARRAASASQHPRLRLYSGPEWLAALAQKRVGWKRHRWCPGALRVSAPARSRRPAASPKGYR